jgi:energy-coupling factor transport system ATP-binding protein
VRDELAFSALNLGHPKNEVMRSVAEWSEKLGLTGELERDPHHLSAGKQQLLLLAAALTARPELLLADEPAAHLDRATRREVLGRVREEVGRGLAVVWVTQDPEEKEAADWVLDLTRESVSGSTRVAPGLGRIDEPLLTLGVSPWDGTDGPHVGVAAALEIPIARAGVTAVEGPNGAGKSVLLAAAAGLVQIDQIRVVKGPGSEPPPIMAAQYPEQEIFEEFVRDEVAYAAVSRGVARAEAIHGAARLFVRLGLDGESFLGRRTWALSGGEKRLVSLVGALVTPGGLLALDEPTVGLDPCRRATLAGLIAESAANRAILIASQDGEWITGLSVRHFTLDELGVHRRASGGRKTD